MWILDTDHVTLWQRNHPAVVRKIAFTNPEFLAVAVVTLEEQLRGRLNAIRKANSEDTIVLAYAGLTNTWLFSETLQCLNLIIMLNISTQN